jgi:hypothetical protein
VAADYFVSFSLNLSDEDRDALDRPDFKLYEQAPAERTPGSVARPASAIPHHLIRVSARAPDDARRALVSTLGREPADLEVGVDPVGVVSQAAGIDWSSRSFQVWATSRGVR